MKHAKLLDESTYTIAHWIRLHLAHAVMRSNPKHSIYASLHTEAVSSNPPSTPSMHAIQPINLFHTHIFMQ